MKKIIFLIIVTILVIGIYFFLKDRKVFYFSIIDYNSSYRFNNFISDYLDEVDKNEEVINYDVQNSRVIDLINLINNNEVIGDRKIKNILIKADLVSLSLGFDELYLKLDNYDFINKYLVNIEDLLKLSRKNCKEKIVFIGFYNFKKDIKYDYYVNFLNKMIRNICDKYNVYFIDTYDLIMYLEGDKFNIEGEHIIFNRINDLLKTSY